MKRRFSVRVAILTVSDLGAKGERKDVSGDAIAAWAKKHRYQVTERDLVPDETGPIAGRLARWADGDRADVILTTGGTGLTARDVTPEATRAVLERAAPGVAEALRAQALAKLPRAALSRGLVGVRNSTLIVNLPGSPAGVKDGLKVLDQTLEHAVQLVRGAPTDH